jgi:DtxR family Mn-dependent transcriptional regulator
VSSPYGNPIPALEELGVDPAAESFLGGTEQLSLRLADGNEHEVVVLRMSEAVQNDTDLLALIRDAGAKPGSSVRAAVMGRNLVLGSRDHEVTLPGFVAEHLFIAAD